MKTIKVIDLLNLVYENKQPKKVKFRDYEFEFDNEEQDYSTEKGMKLFYAMFTFEENPLSVNVEVIDETTEKMDKIELNDEFIVYYERDTTKHCMNTNKKDREFYIPKINWLIDKVNCLLEERGKNE